MEANLTDARDALKVMITRLEEVVPTVTMTTPITLHAITPHMQTMQTTFGREVCTWGYFRYDVLPNCSASAVVLQSPCRSSLVDGEFIHD